VHLDDLLGGDLAGADHPGQGAGGLAEQGVHGKTVMQPERCGSRGASTARGPHPEAPRLSPRKCEERSLCERSDERGLAQGQVETAASPDPGSMLSCVFF
jgi:hypothetical protein